MASCTIYLPPKPVLECPSGTKLNQKNFINYFKHLGTIPSTIRMQTRLLSIQGDCKEGCVEELAAAVVAIEKVIEDLMSIFPKVYDKLKCMEEELEHAARQFVKEIDLFFQKKLVEILSSVLNFFGIPNPLELPIPFLDGVVLKDFFTTEGKVKIKAAVAANIESVEKFFSSVDKTITDFFSGTWNLKSIEHYIEELYQRVVNWIKKVMNDPINTMIDALYKILKTFIPIAALVDLVEALEKSFDEIYQSAKKKYVELKEKLLSGELEREARAAIKKQMDAIMNILIDTILAIPVPFFGTVGDVLQINIEEEYKNFRVFMKERVIARIKDGWNDLMEKIRKIQHTDWLKEAYKLIKKLSSAVIEAIKKVFPLIGDFLKAIEAIVLNEPPICVIIQTIMSAAFSVFDIVYSLLPSCITIKTQEGGIRPKPAT